MTPQTTPGQADVDAQTTLAGGSTLREPVRGCADATHEPARLRKGQRANWSTQAKTRAWLIAASCMQQLKPACKTDDGIADHVDGCSCSKYRIVIDERRRHTTGRVHTTPCVRCGPSGKPAAAGTPWSKAHSLADAQRIASKRLLRDLWREAKRIHEEAES